MNKNGYLSLLLFLSSTCGVLGANQLTQEHQHHLFNLLASGLNLPSLSPQAKGKAVIVEKKFNKDTQVNQLVCAIDLSDEKNEHYRFSNKNEKELRLSQIKAFATLELPIPENRVIEIVKSDREVKEKELLSFSWISRLWRSLAEKMGFKTKIITLEKEIALDNDILGYIEKLQVIL